MASDFDAALARSLIDQIPDDTDVSLLRAGLAVLTRDFFFYLQDKPRDDSSWLDDVVDQLEAEEMGTFDDGAFPYYEAHDTGHLPSGLAAAAAAGKFSYAPLLDDAIDHGWTHHPGEMLQIRYLVRLGSHFEDEVAGPDGLCESLERGGGEVKERAAVLTAKALETIGLAGEPFWYPLGVYVGVLLAREGFTR